MTERGSDRTVAGVLLSIIDDRGGIAVAALSDENGAFELRAPAPGRYVLEAKRIGLRQVRFPAFTLAEGIMTGIHYPTPVHLQPAYDTLGYGTGSFPVSEAVARRVVSLPLYPELPLESVDRVCEAVRGLRPRQGGV